LLSAITGYVSITSTSTTSLSGLTLTSSGYSGGYATVTLNLGALTVTSTGWVENVADVSWTLPALQVLSYGWLEDTTPTSHYTLAVETEHIALSTYTNFEFDIMARFNGVDLAISSTGLYSLTGDTDNGTDIDSVITTGQLDMAESAQRMEAVAKRIREAWLVAQSDSGELTIELTDEDGIIYEYTAEGLPTSSFGEARVPFARGHKDRLVTLSIKNINGDDFIIDSFRIKAEPLPARHR